MKKATVEKATTSKKSVKAAEVAEDFEKDSSADEDLNQWLHSHDKLKISLKGDLPLDDDEYAQEELDEEELEEEIEEAEELSDDDFGDEFIEKEPKIEKRKGGR